jgi:hypothetical protein
MEPIRAVDEIQTFLIVLIDEQPRSVGRLGTRDFFLSRLSNNWLKAEIIGCERNLKMSQKLFERREIVTV